MRTSFDSTGINNNIPTIISFWSTQPEESCSIKSVRERANASDSPWSSGFLEPDVGMPEYLAQHYFKQVVAGMVGNEFHQRSSHLWLTCLGVSSRLGCCSSRFVHAGHSFGFIDVFRCWLDLKPENLLVANNSESITLLISQISFVFIGRCSEDLWLWLGNIISQSNNERRT